MVHMKVNGWGQCFRGDDGEALDRETGCSVATTIVARDRCLDRYILRPCQVDDVENACS